METQAAGQARISQLSQMNAFYGIPLLSQETAQAVMQGKASRPEVYTPGENIAQTQADENNPAKQSTARPEQNREQNQNRLNTLPEDRLNLSPQAQKLRQTQQEPPAAAQQNNPVAANRESAAAARASGVNPSHENNRATTGTARHTAAAGNPPGDIGIAGELNRNNSTTQNPAMANAAAGNQSEAAVYQQAPGGQPTPGRGLRQPGTIFNAVG